MAHLHHETTTDGIEGVGHDSGNSCHNLSHGPLGKNTGVLGLFTEDGTSRSVVESEVCATVHDDSLHTHAESLVQREEA
jgi:hypothetical protein